MIRLMLIQLSLGGFLIKTNWLNLHISRVLSTWSATNRTILSHLLVVDF
jgi:hypothetical protein